MSRMTRAEIEALVDATEANDRALRGVVAPIDIREEAMDIIAAAGPLCAALREALRRAADAEALCETWKMYAKAYREEAVAHEQRATAAEAALREALRRAEGAERLSGIDKAYAEDMRSLATAAEAEAARLKAELAARDALLVPVQEAALALLVAAKADRTAPLNRHAEVIVHAALATVVGERRATCPRCDRPYSLALPKAEERDVCVDCAEDGGEHETSPFRCRKCKRPLAWTPGPNIDVRRCAVCYPPDGATLATDAPAKPDRDACPCGGDGCRGVDDNERHQCGGPAEACAVPGCKECGADGGEHG